MGQNVGNQSETLYDVQETAKSQKATHSLPGRVGEEWPRLLTKKFLAGYFGCSHTNGKRFRTLVLPPEVLEAAGIAPEVAYNQSTKTFNVIDSMKLTKILRGFCLISMLILTEKVIAQTGSITPAPPQSIVTPAVGTGTNIVNPLLPTVKYSRDSFLRDTIPGLAVVTDSIIRMVQAPAGAYKYEKVMSTVVVSALWVKEFRYLVRASDGGTDPFDSTQRFFFLSGGQIDPNRIIIFKQDPKK